jgi:hypothetical protein
MFTNRRASRPAGRGAAALVAVCAIAATIGAPGASASGRTPQTFHIITQDSWLHDTALGAVQDTNWNYSQQADPSDPCSVSVQASGKQKVVFDHPAGRAAFITIYPGGRVSPATLNDPATVTRTASISTGEPSSQCQGQGQGDGPGGPGQPLKSGGTVAGVVHLHLAVQGDVLTISGAFVPNSYGSDFEAVVSSDFMYGYYADLPQKSLSLLPTHWLLPSNVWNTKDVFVDVKRSPQGGYTYSITHYDAPGFQGATVTGMSLVLERHDDIGPIH